MSANKLLLNQTARNHIRFFPMEGTIPDLPETEAERIRWCEQRFKQLQDSFEAKRLALYKNRSKGYQISVWRMDGLYYIVQCLRNEWKTFNDTIYITKDGDDAVAIAKFLHDNIEEIKADYKQQILDARDALLKSMAERNKGAHDA